MVRCSLNSYYTCWLNVDKINVPPLDYELTDVNNCVFYYYCPACCDVTVRTDFIGISVQFQHVNDLYSEIHLCILRIRIFVLTLAAE